MTKQVSRCMLLSLGAAFILAAPPVMLGQSSPAQPSAKKCKPNAKDAACQAPPASPPPAPSAAAENPFPVEDSRHGGDAEGTPPLAPAPNVPSTANGLPARPSGNDADPPDESNRPLRLPRDGYSTGGAPGSSDGGTSSSRSDDDDDVAPTTAAPDAPVKASKLKDLGAGSSSGAARAKLEETRFQDDLKVGKFYLQDGNAQGAYLRYKDAVDHVPDDPDARFGLAEAAAKLNKRDEAILNYRETIRLDPDGDHDKAARAALKRFGTAVK